MTGWTVATMLMLGMVFKKNNPGCSQSGCSCDDDSGVCCPGGVAPASLDLDVDLDGCFCTIGVSGVYELDHQGNCLFTHTETLAGTSCGLGLVSVKATQATFTLDLNGRLEVTIIYRRVDNNNLYGSRTYVWTTEDCDGELTYDSESWAGPVLQPAACTTHTAEIV